MFLYLAIGIVLLSALLAALGVTASYDIIDANGDTTTVTVVIKSLLTGEGWNWITTNLVSNFAGFYPLGVVITIMIFIGVAQGTGLLDALIHKIAIATPASLITPVVAFLGIMLSLASSTGYVVLVPLSAILYAKIGRHPIAGIAVAFAATSAGWGANLLIAPNDPALAGITQGAANLLDPNYIVDATANWYISAASVFLLVAVITVVDRFITSKNLGSYKGSAITEIDDLTNEQKRGLKYAGIATLIYVGFVMFAILNGMYGWIGSFGSSLINPATGNLIGSPVLSGIIAYMAFLFLIPALTYGIVTKTITNEKDVVNMMTHTVSGLASFIVIIFFAAQFTAFFAYTNLGTIIAINGSEFLQSIGFTSVLIFIPFVIVIGFTNLFMAVDTAKWAIIAPIFVPMFMTLGFSPELTQMFYRIGDSSTNIIAPLMPFFPLVLSIMKDYDEEAGMGTLIATMLPYTAAIMVFWVAFTLIWYFLGLPLGPGVPLTI